MKLKIALMTPHHKQNWLMTSITWSYDVFWKGFLIYQFPTGYMTMVMTSHVAFFNQGASVNQVLPDDCSKSTTKMSELLSHFLWQPKFFLTAIKNNIRKIVRENVNFSEQKRSVLIDSTNFKYSWFVRTAKKKSISHFPVLFKNILVELIC